MDAGVDAGDITVAAAAAAAAAADVNVMQHGGTDGRREDRWAQLWLPMLRFYRPFGLV